MPVISQNACKNAQVSNCDSASLGLLEQCCSKIKQSNKKCRINVTDNAQNISKMPAKMLRTVTVFVIVFDFFSNGAKILQKLPRKCHLKC